MLAAAFCFPVAAQAGQIACTPTSGFTNCVIITYSGADQTLTIPANVLSVQARVWGAAGGGTNIARGYDFQGGGAGGGYATGTLAVTSGQTLTVVVGQGGIFGSTSTTYGGGGAGGSSSVATIYGGEGGGMSAVFSAAAKTAANALVVAGGGGGGSPGADGSAQGAGGGGGTTGGQDTSPTLSGRGGAQLAGGAAATGTSACSVVQTAGAQFQGGRGGSANGASSNEGGGGGGGGYFGGGGGLCQNGGTQNGGGGGGSSFIAGVGVTAASTTAGVNFPFSGAACAGTAASGGASDPLYTAGIGVGSCYATGGDGQVVLQWTSATVTLTKTSNGAVGGFTFTGNNGWASQTITTVTSGTGVAGTTQSLTSPLTATTITEAIPSGYSLASVTCSGLGAGGTATPNLSAGSIAFNALATAAGSNITCTFTNTKLPTITLTKISNAGVGPFTFTGTNGWTSQTITTTVSGTGVSGATQILSAAATATTITEAIPSTFLLSSVTCSGLGSGGTALPNLATGVLSLNAAATAAGSNITCTFTNTKLIPSMTVIKSASTAGPVAVGAVYTYTFKVKNTGNTTITGIFLTDTFNGYGIAPAPNNETLSLDAAPLGDSANGTVNDGIWATLGPGDEVTFTAPYTVTQSDIDLLQ